MTRSRTASLTALAGSAVLLAGVVAWTATRPAPSDSVADLPPMAGDAGRGARAFYGEDFGGLSLAALSTNAIPLRLSAAALVMDARASDPSVTIDQAGYERVMRRFGFMTPRTIANAPGGRVAISPREPLGITHGTASIAPGLPVRIANLGCAACHSGPSYDRRGMPHVEDAWLGQPNTSIDLQQYTDSILHGFRTMRGRDDELVSVAGAIGGPMSRGERWTLLHVVLPMVGRRLDRLAGTAHALPFPNGWPGATNGVAALRARLHAPTPPGIATDAGAVSIPDLGDRQWRTSLLADGAYSIGPDRPTTGTDPVAGRLDRMATAMTFFTVPSMGVEPDDAIRRLPQARLIVSYLQGRRRQPFPGPVDPESAERGHDTYSKACASCHGETTRGRAPTLVRFPNVVTDVGTDALRARSFDDALAASVRRTSYGARFGVRSTGRYAAPPLTGLWSSAPYLHNGSVPTLRALLDPSKRPDRFMVGGHALDLDAVGIALTPDGRYPQGYRPWSSPRWHDVRAPGRGNRGHLYGADLSKRRRSELIEYLKTL